MINQFLSTISITHSHLEESDTEMRILKVKQLVGGRVYLKRTQISIKDSDDPNW